MTQTPAPQDSHDTPSTLNDVRPSNAARHTPGVLKRRVDDERLPVADAQDPAVDASVTDESQSANVQAQSAAEVSTDAGKEPELPAGKDEESSRSGLIVFGLGGLALAGVAAAGGSGSSPATAIVPPVKTAPPMPTLSTSTGTGAINDAGSVTVGNIENGGKWDYSLDGGKTWTPGNGSSIGGGVLPEGANRVTVRQVDDVGNQSTATADVVKDSTVAQPSIGTSTGTGAINDAGSVTVGNLETGGKWDYSLDGGKTWTPGNGSAIAGSALSEGTHHVTVRQTDVAGNQSAASADVVKDTVALAPTLTLAKDTGHGGDRLTNDGSLSVGGIEPNATWEYKIDGGGWLVGGPSGIVDPGFADGTHSVRARQTDAAGNLSQETELNFSIDKSAPGGVGVFLNADSGVVGDRIVQNANLLVLGTEIGGTTNLSVDGAPWGTVPNQPDATIVDMDGRLSEGVRSIGVQQVDAAGNASGWTFLKVTIDRTAPGAAFTGQSGSGLAITSDEGGEVFLVRDTLSPAPDLVDIHALDASSWRGFDSAGAGNETVLTDLSGLSAGTYHVYARDGAGNATQVVSPLNGTGTGTDPLKVLIGSAGAEVINLPDGGAVVAGHGGADRFVFKAGQTGTFVFTDIDNQRIRGEADMDILDLSAALKNYTAPPSDDAANDLFIKRVNEAGKSTILVDVDGNGDFQNAELVLVLTGPAAHQFVQLATPGEVLIG